MIHSIAKSRSANHNIRLSKRKKKAGKSKKMDKIVTRSDTFLKKYWIEILFLVLVTAIHIPMKFYGDDWAFYEMSENTPFFSFMKERYMTWSSRLFIEAVLYFMVKVPILWKIADIVIYWLAARIFADIFLEKDSEWFAFLLLLVYPFYELYSAGFMATIVNYLWPSVSALAGVYPVIHCLKNGRDTSFTSDQKELHPVIGVLCMIAVIFAANLEQYAVILLCIYGIFIFVSFWRWKMPLKKRLYFLITEGLILLELLFILTCPGNQVRKASEIKSWFPDFKQLSVPDKIQLGFSSTMKGIFMDDIWLMVLLAWMCILLLLYQNKGQVDLQDAARFHKKGICGMISVLFPAVLLGICALEKYVLPFSITGIGEIQQYGYFRLSSGITGKALMPVIIFLAAMLGILGSFRFLLQTKEFIVCAAVFLLGLASRMIMGFSPTIWASDNRTFTSLNFCLCFCILILYGQLEKKKAVPHSFQYIMILFGMICWTFSFIRMLAL